MLDSIVIQTYNNYEVIVSDDSDDDSVQQLVQTYQAALPLRYFHNQPALGTPANWMAGMEQAKGEWIKLIHDDDWLTDANSLAAFAAAADPAVPFIFSGYYAFYEATGKKVDQTITPARFAAIRRRPHLLFASNELGPPSVVMLHRRIREYYDPQLKWLVDLEYYIRMLSQHPARYIASPLICMSYNDSQVTNSCSRNPEVELPEAFYLLQRYGTQPLQTVMVYDAWWRLLRNLSITSESDLRRYIGQQAVPPLLQQLIRHQRHIPAAWLKQGLVSKPAMLLSYLFNRSRLAG